MIKVYLDDRGFLDSDGDCLSQVLRQTQAFDWAFGLSVNQGKSAFMMLGDPRAAANSNWPRLALKTCVKYLGAGNQVSSGHDSW